MKRQVPVRSERWDGLGLGWIEADTVAHCGGSMEGSFAYTLTFTDTDSQWTELRAIWNKGGHATMLRMSEIEQTLPFLIKGINTDNGPEFLNGHLIRHFKERPVVIAYSDQVGHSVRRKSDTCSDSSRTPSPAKSDTYSERSDAGCLTVYDFKMPGVKDSSVRTASF
jgi:hypothetical protein